MHRSSFADHLATDVRLLKTGKKMKSDVCKVTVKSGACQNHLFNDILYMIEIKVWKTKYGLKPVTKRIIEIFMRLFQEPEHMSTFLKGLM